MILLDLFSGIGGFSLGLDKWVTKHYYSEIDKHAIAIYKHNFKESIYVGSVESIGDIERPNIITFGSPCQDFSIAGKRSGLEGSRSSLIQYALNTISKFRPDVFIWENVKGVFSSNDGADFWAIVKAFADIGGYRLEWQLLNTRWFLPQNRERIYLVGHLGNRSGHKVFPIGETSSLTNNGHTEVANTLQHPVHSGGNYRGMTMVSGLNQIGNLNRHNYEMGGRVYSSNGIAKTLGGDGGNNDDKTGLYKVQPFLTPNRAEKRQNGRRFKEDGEPAFTLNTQDQHGVMIERSQIRRLTPLECCRLQGFPDDWNEYGEFDGKVVPMSDTQRYKQCGNAVSVPVVQAVGDTLLKNLI